MAHFRATVQGNRGVASRCGSRNSGIVARINGWHFGVTVRARHDENKGDTFEIYRTGGSTGAISSKLIAEISVDWPFVEPSLQHQEHQQ